MKTKCTFLPLAAIYRKVKDSFISFHVFSCALMQEVWAVIHKIHTKFRLILPALTPTDRRLPLLKMAGQEETGVGRRIRALFIEKGAKQMGAIWW